MSNEYFDLQRPETDELPILVDVPHAGERIPDEVREQFCVDESTLKRDLDLYVDQIWRNAPSEGATLLAADVSRYVIDLNRAPDDISPEAVQGGKCKYEDGYYQNRGVVWRTTTDRVEVLDRPLTQQQYKSRLDAFYHPYHRMLSQQIERIKDTFGYCILIDGHSMPSTGRSDHSDTGTRRADIVPGDVSGTSCATRITRTVENHFRQNGCAVSTNDPYQGGWITRYYGNPDEDVHAIQIEINRDLYMNEKTFEPDREGLSELRQTCTGLLEKIADLSLD